MSADDETTRPDRRFRWWTDTRVLSDFIRWARAELDLSYDRAIEVVEAPWKWTEEFDAMVRSQRASQRPTADVLEDDRKVG